MNILDYFRDENNTERGWLGIKGKKFAIDKQKHVVLGLFIFFTATIIFYLKLNTDFEKLNASIQNAFGATFVVAVAKEVLDFALFKMGKKPNWRPMPDIVATIALPLLILIISIIIL